MRVALDNVADLLGDEVCVGHAAIEPIAADGWITQSACGLASVVVELKDVKPPGEGVLQTCDEARAAITLIHRGLVPAPEIITHRLPLAKWEEAFAAVENLSALKALLIP